MQIRKIKPYELFKNQDTIKYHSKATSESVNNPLLLLKSEIDTLFNYIQLKFSEDPLKWDSTHQYKMYDLVEYSGNVYQALEDNKNSEPPNSSWQILDIYKNSLNSQFLRNDTPLTLNYDLKLDADIQNKINIFNTANHPLSEIRFNSYVNLNSDYGYIRYYDDNNTYNKWGDSAENSALVLGVQNDGQNAVSDVVAIESPAGIFLNAPGVYVGDKYGYKVWHSGNDGSGSGLDADLLDGYNSDVNAGANTIVLRDNKGVIHGTSTSAQYADIAERYYADDTYTPGTVMSIGGLKEVTLYQDGMKLAGVVSTNPAFKMNDDTNENHALMPFIALKGKIPVKTSVNIKKGQYVLASDVRPGECYGVDTLTFDRSLKLIGIALEDYFVNDVVKTVNVKV